jgi:signal transduction histidine kinase
MEKGPTNAMRGRGTRLSRGQLRALSVAVPLAGLAVLYPVRVVLLRRWPAGAVDSVLGLLVAAGVLVFSWTIFRVLAHQENDLATQHRELEHRYQTERRLTAQLEALHEAALAIASLRQVDETLQRLVDLARDLVGARYAALGALGPQGAIDDFYTSGMSGAERGKLGSIPQGHGVVSVLLRDGVPLRLRDIAEDPRAVGFPPGHPRMRSLLGVPITHGGQVVGNLYLTDKVGSAEFSAEDERLLALLAGHAAMVIANARLAEQVGRLAIAAERERIGKDLHDGVIQAIYAVNLELEDAVEDVAEHPEVVRERIEGVIDRLGEVMKDIRRYILGLQPEHAATQPLPEALATLLAEARAHTLLETDVKVEGEQAWSLSPVLTGALVQIAREAIANVVRHARASRLQVTLEVAGNTAHLQIADNGVGFDPAGPLAADHHGLRNLRQRAADLGGRCNVQASPGRGTTVDVWAPFAAPEREEVRA